MRRFICIALACVVALAAFGCGGSPKKDEPKGKIDLGGKDSGAEKKGEVKGIPGPVGGGVVTDDGLQ
jgi:hypothetical protein